MATEYTGNPFVRVEGDGVVDEINFDFPLNEGDESKLYKMDMTDPDDPGDPELVDPSEYTVVIEIGVDGGVVEMDDPLEDNFEYVFFADTEESQGLTIPLTEGKLDMRLVEYALDKLSLRDRERKWETRKALSFPKTSEIIDVEVDDPEAGCILLWNDDGTRVVSSDMTYEALKAYLAASLAAAQAAAAAAASAAADAQGYRDDAASAAADAQGYRDDAANSATDAGNSETAAALSASQAAQAVTDAETARDAAQTAQTAAEAAQAAAEAAAGIAQPNANQFITETLANGAAIDETTLQAGGAPVVNFTGRQVRPVVSSGGQIDVDDTPFGTDNTKFGSGAVIILQGTSDANYPKITPADVAWGVQDPRGTILLKKNVVIHLRCDTAAQRWIADGRNI